jgi:hypothetical protein
MAALNLEYSNAVYFIDYHQSVLASAIYVLCPQHLKEYAAVNDRISREGLEWIID